MTVNTKKVVYPALAIASLLFFTIGIPIDIYDSYTTFIVIIGGALTTFLAGASVLLFLPVKENQTPEEKKSDNSGCIVMASLLLFFFGYSAFLIFHETSEKTAEFKKYGKSAVATITDGHSIKTRKADFTSVTVQFKTADGKPYTTNIDMSAGEFANYSKNQEVLIVYSSRYPSLAEILRSPSDIEKFTNTKYRAVSLADLISILNLKTAEQTNAYLNGISQKWDYENGSDVNTVLYVNKIRNIAVKVSAQKELDYMHDRLDPNLFADEFKKSGFTPISGISGRRLFSNGQYLIAVRNEQIKDEDPRQIAGFRMVTVVSILKNENQVDIR